MPKFLVALGLAAFVGSALTSTHQDRGCLHEAGTQTPAEAARFRDALFYTRLVNSHEAAHYSRAQQYARTDELPVSVAAPAGFQAQLATDGKTYSFSVKDTLDPCHFAFWSDQDGIIYTAEPLR